ncbi:MAG: TldD/PmbA family protein [Verrucomicrobiales bacterium]|nr:TldD/PmbA family protein [Verrucomicrobiales bacterium]
MIPSEQDLRTLTEKILKLSKADSAVVHVSAAHHANLRFANNDITSNASQNLLSLSITSNFGTRSASVSWNQTDAHSLQQAVTRSEQMARLSPPNPEFMPPLAAQSYLKANSFSAHTAASGPDQLANWLQAAIDSTRAAKVAGAGYLSRKTSASAMATSAGLFVYQPSTVVDFSITARTQQGNGSGWASTQVTDSKDLTLKSTADRAVEKALQSVQASDLPAARYPVILEASAARDLINLLLWSLSQRSSDEKRSFLNQLSKGDPIGQNLFGKKASLYSDPTYQAAPSSICSSDGLPKQRTEWISQGTLKHLHCGRYWAKKQQIPAIPAPGNLIMPGDNQPLEKLISQVDRGILITRLWYLRMVQPQTLLYTGLTRDGTFLIENGKISRPVNNFRFNESPTNILRNLIASGTPERVLGSESSMPMHIPPLLVDDFHFSSVSDAV